MAVRKKSETIHLRVDPLSKFLLEGLASITKTTSTRVIEELILNAARAEVIDDVDIILSEELLKNGVLTLDIALRLSLDSRHPIYTKLRTYYLAVDALNFKDHIIARSIILHPKLFSGQDYIFHESEQIIKAEDFSEVPRVNLEKIQRHMDDLNKFAEFCEKNPKLKIKYEAFLELTATNNDIS